MTQHAHGRVCQHDDTRGPKDCIFFYLSALVCFQHLFDAIAPPPSVSPPSLLSASVSPSSSPCLLFLPHVYFIGPLRRLGINKLCISLCARSEAPFRNGTELVCWRARVYPKRLHQTRSRVSGSPDCPCSFVTAPGPPSHTEPQPPPIPC